MLYYSAIYKKLVKNQKVNKKRRRDNNIGYTHKRKDGRWATVASDKIILSEAALEFMV